MPTDLAAKYDYCIVGAGPGGLQLGQFMLEKGRDYKIFERQMRPGSFFARFPTHRELISINKRNTGRTNPEFNRRHDWNSLVGHDEVPTIPSESLRPLASSVSGALRLANAHHVGLTPRASSDRTAKRYPPADTMVEYLQDFAKVQEEAGHIAYGTSVNRISRDTDSGRFWLDLLPSALDGVVSALLPAPRPPPAMTGSLCCMAVLHSWGAAINI
jgi:cation diffusion facilitator CzcD-associated flavoprotein CzcO